MIHIKLIGMALTVLTTSVCAQKTTTPNIVFVLADDMGIGDLGCYGQDKIKTPNIDLLAEQGLRFTHHYSGSTVSAPSRCSLLTGKHTGHSYIRGNKGMKTEEGLFDLCLPPEEHTVAELLKQKGYATMCVGKWGLGGPHTTGSPIKKGFDYFFGYLSQGAAHRYYPEFLYENEKKVMLNKKIYSHTLIMEKGLDFIRNHADKPFFAYFAVTPPHADLDYPDLSQYKNSFPETPYINNRPQGGYKTQMKPKAAYASMISEVDKNVGQIIALLKEKGIWENTIFIFSSDNGVHNVGGHDPEFFNSNGPFRGYKRDLYEGGVRTPFIVNWPSVIKKKRVTDCITTFWDFLPTMADLTNSSLTGPVDGISYLPLLKGEKMSKRHDYVYFEFYEQKGKQAILKDGWKMIRLNISKPEKLKEELYYLPSDEGETQNIIEQNTAKADELRALMQSAHTKNEHFKW